MLTSEAGGGDSGQGVGATGPGEGLVGADRNHIRAGRASTSGTCNKRQSILGTGNNMPHRKQISISVITILFKHMQYLLMQRSKQHKHVKIILL